MIVDSFILNVSSKLYYTVLSKLSMTVASKTNLSPVITHNMVLLLLNPVKDGFFYFYPRESFRVKH